MSPSPKPSPTIKPNTCPYCGGPYTLTEACNGPRKRDLSNHCKEMRLHSRLVSRLADLDLREGGVKGAP